MKIGVIGAGNVGAACALSAVHRGSCRELVLVDEDRQKAESAALDVRHAVPLGPVVDVRAGGEDDLRGAALVVITAGVNEHEGGADDPQDPKGRLKLLDQNIPVYRDVIPRVAAAPDAVLLVVTDPPDPLADLTRQLAGHGRVLSAGTLLDSLRFRVQVAGAFGVPASSVGATVIGEHGRSAVLLWSGVTVGDVPLEQVARSFGMNLADLKPRVERAVKGANIQIIRGIGASQYAIGTVVARLTEAVLRDERVVLPVGTYQEEHGLTFSLPGVVGRGGVERVLMPELTDEERAGLQQSIEALGKARERLGGQVPTR